jgi:hypothetical protein
MKTLAFDGRMGVSGDMLCAALIAVGADPAVLDPVTEALDVRYAVGSTTKAGVAATTVDVLVDDASADEGDAASHDHSHDHDHTHAEGHGPDRSYPEVVDLVEGMALTPAVERDALAVFRRLGEAEAAVHGTDLEDTHFHEVGADDAIADVVGAVLLLVDLGVERVVTTPVSAGGGTVSMSHGTYPVPAPAVAELAAAADWSLRGGPVDRLLGEIVHDLVRWCRHLPRAHERQGTLHVARMLVDAQYRDLGVEMAREFDRELDGPAGVLRTVDGDKVLHLPLEYERKSLSCLFDRPRKSRSEICLRHNYKIQ